MVKSTGSNTLENEDISELLLAAGNLLQKTAFYYQTKNFQKKLKTRQITWGGGGLYSSILLLTD